MIATWRQDLAWSVTDLKNATHVYFVSDKKKKVLSRRLEKGQGRRIRNVPGKKISTEG